MVKFHWSFWAIRAGGCEEFCLGSRENFIDVAVRTMVDYYLFIMVRLRLRLLWEERFLSFNEHVVEFQKKYWDKVLMRIQWGPAEVFSCASLGIPFHEFHRKIHVEFQWIPGIYPRVFSEIHL